jgi:hypothetical protein
MLAEVGELVREMLWQAPDRQLPLKEILSQLTRRFQKRYRRPYNVLHGYVSRLDFIEKYTGVDGKTVMCRLVQEDETGVRLKENAGQIQNRKLREDVLRALSFLNENDVDVGLFLLGKEFEGALRRFMLRASETGQITSPVSPSSTLDQLIKTVEKERIVTDKSDLNFLRQSRNDRAHGPMPSEEERKQLMAKRDLTAGLYIDYIKFFDDKLNSSLPDD